MQGANNCILGKNALACFYDAVGKTKSLHIYCWEMHGCCEQVFHFLMEIKVLTLKNSRKTFVFASLCSFLFLSIKSDWIYNKKFMLHQNIIKSLK